MSKESVKTENGKLYFDNSLMHIGVGWDDNPPGIGSGRYPHGSGERPNQHLNFYQKVLEAKKNGLTDEEIRKSFDMNTASYRAEISIASSEYRKEQTARAKELWEAKDENGNKLYSKTDIAKILGITEGSVRNYLKSNDNDSSSKTKRTMELLKKQCDKDHYLDVGVSSNFDLGCTKQTMDNATRLLKEVEGYSLFSDIKVKQAATKYDTTLKILAPPGTTKKEVYENLGKIILPNGGCEVWPTPGDKKIGIYGIEYPTSVNSNRVGIKYAEDGGKDKDGIIEIRRGVKDLMMGNASYAQLRIAVDGTHYIKGMAVYSDNMPEGKDIIFNTNKHSDVPMMGPKDNTVLKPLKEDKDNPFGATIKKQIRYEEGGKIILSPINIVNEEGDWGGEFGWSNNIASQMLSKQNVPLIKKQLKTSYADRVSEFDDIISLTNPVVKKKFLEAFADNCDSAAVDLKASPFPRQSWKVIIPITSLKDDEIYAPTYEKGETVVLVRYPHGGTFEIPQLKVNNNNKEGKIILGNTIDAVGINSKVAAQLSGADFDGDTVLVIPANGSSSKVRINTTRLPASLADFDPKEEYPKRDGMKIMKDGSQKQREMGIISNLITDMTIKGAPEEELVKAIKHSMVVIDAPKHELDYQRSYKENEIERLKREWQKKESEDGSYTYGGASTLLSRAKGESRIPERKEGQIIFMPNGTKKIQYIDPETGEKLYSETGRTKKDFLKTEGGVPKLDPLGKKQYYDTGEKVTEKSTQMYETKDARTLSSGTIKEELYAEYANGLKALANEARKAYLVTPNLKYNPESKKKYEKEVESLKNKLMLSMKNAPKERQAQILASLNFRAKLEENPDMTSEEKKKYKNQAITGAREIVGASKYRFNGYAEGDESQSNKKKGLSITEKEWEAIQNGAITNETLTQIVANSDLDYLKKLAMPKTYTQLSEAKIAQIKAMSDSGFTLAEIANKLNLSKTTISKHLKFD